MPEIIDLFIIKPRGVKGFKEGKANAVLAIFTLKFPNTSFVPDMLENRHFGIPVLQYNGTTMYY